MTNYAEVEPRLRKVFVRTFGGSKPLSADTDLWSYLPDSLEMTGLMLEMTEEFDCEMPWEEVKTGRVTTFKQAVEFFVDRINGKAKL